MEFFKIITFKGWKQQLLERKFRVFWQLFEIMENSVKYFGNFDNYEKLNFKYFVNLKIEKQETYTRSRIECPSGHPTNSLQSGPFHFSLH